MWRSAPAAALLALLLAAPPSAHPADRPQASPARPTVTWSPSHPRIGDVALVSVRGTGPGATLEGRAGDRPLRFFPHERGHAAVVGFDLDVTPGRVAWELVVLEAGGGRRTTRGHITVKAREFSVQRLTVPESMVDLDPDTERRAVAETARLRALYATTTPERLWRGPFARPVTGTEPGTGFGARRVINGKPRSPHGGADYAAPVGTPVVAANAGRVAMVEDFFFPGRLVIIDHGLGLYTLYFHLDTASVRAGEVIERGQAVGTVGMTGRVTGPHLHFGVQVGPARVDPATLLELID